MNASLSSVEILDLLEGMILQQRVKVMAMAREFVPGITEEDVRNPHDFPALRASDTFNFEDGILAGLMAAQMALRAEMNQKKH